MKYLLFIIFLFPLLLAGQSDSSLLDFKTLDVEDIDSESFSESQSMISASRTQKVVGEIPFTSYVITKEEIRDNGYTTLVDVMKTIPGIRVSQPGSAIEGELFLMRGLIGNQNTKILINDVPIKPAFVLGMPIGAQLPIKQAERIEIIFGPAAALYGSDASAGVINIILRESERPVFVNADLNFSARNYRGLSLLLGGKFGRNNNIINFTTYGNYLQFDDQRILDSASVYDPYLYIDSIRFRQMRMNNWLPNYQTEVGSSVPIKREFPHLSRSFGVNLKWRNLSFIYENFYRRDHSALGFNPTAISISNQQNYYGELYDRWNLSYISERGKITWQTITTISDSKSDKFSSTDYVLNVLGVNFLNQFTTQSQGDLQMLDSLWQSRYNEYFSGSRYRLNASSGSRVEQLMSYRPLESLEMTFGANVFSNSATYEDYLQTPPETGTVTQDTTEQVGIGLFGQVYFVSDKFNLIAGVQGFNLIDSDQGSDDDWEVAPRIAGIFKANRNLNFRAFYASGFRLPSPFYTFNTLSLDADNRLERLNQSLESETTNSFELAAKLKVPSLKTEMEAIYFYSRTDNLIGFDRLDVPGPDPNRPAFILGYFNSGDKFSQMNGLQFNIQSKELIPAIELHTKLYVQYVFGKELLKRDLILEEDEIINQVRAQPNWTVQLKTDMKIGRRIGLNLFHLYHSASISRQVSSSKQYESNKEEFTIPGYYTLDGMFICKLTDNFQAHVKVTNLFNKNYFGIDATGTTDDLIRNPQSAVWVLFGLSYQL